MPIVRYLDSAPLRVTTPLRLKGTSIKFGVPLIQQRSILITFLTAVTKLKLAKYASFFEFSSLTA